MYPTLNVRRLCVLVKAVKKKSEKVKSKETKKVKEEEVCFMS
jgi:hypothetical protein